MCRFIFCNCQSRPSGDSCGTKVGTVDHLEGENQLKLTKDENDQHHLIPTSWIGEVKEDQVILNKNSEEVKENWQAI
ncbi:DUF2171 domain-containing protein [Acinetobacter baumannii]